MAELKVRDLGTEEEKSSQEVEADLLKKHEEQQTESVKVALSTEDTTEQKPVVDEQKAEEPVVPDPVETNKIEDADVLSYIKDRYDKDINSVDDLLATKESNEELPEDVATFLKYKKDTGRGIEDFVRLNRDLDAMNEDKLLAEYLKDINPHLDNEDIEFELESKYSFDDEYDDESEVKKRRIAKKQELAKAKAHFGKLKEQYTTPLESRETAVPKGDQEAYKAYQEHIAQSKTVEEQNNKRRDYFFEKTNELFDTNFEGFKFNVSDKEMVFKPNETGKIKESQSDVNNFINSHLDDNGLIKDAAAYHRSLSVAMNPDAFANFFYEQGKADAVESISKESKNIDMRRSPETVSQGGFKVTGTVPDSGSRLVIRSNKKH
tara:strand:+ start:184 stop:1317 length:1134 start_codon:yes stop_codon:yes gene_type:complete